MKVVHISQTIYGGAGRAAWRLHQSMLQNGVNSLFLSMDEETNHLNTQFQKKVQKQLPQTISQRITWKFEREITDKIKLKEKKEIECAYEVIKNMFDCEISSLPYGPVNIEKNKFVVEADLIILHWVSQMFDWPVFFEHLKHKKVIWTMHDMNPFKGLFHYDDDEAINYPTAHVLDVKVKSIKKFYLQKRKRNLKFAAPSMWLMNEAMNSEVLKGFEFFHVPYSLDLSLFNDKADNNLKEKYGFKNDDIIILFAAQNLANRRKGFDLLLDAIKQVNHPFIKFVAIGDSTIEDTGNTNIIFIPKIKNDELLADYFKLADAFILPSREDNLPNVIMEAFACGCPIIGFPVGGIKEHVISGITGVLATDVTGSSLAAAILRFIDTRGEYNRQTIRRYAEEQFSGSKQVNSYLTIFKSFQ